MFFIIYETTNTIDGKKYRGMHATHDVGDGYLGSGTYLKRAVKKHGLLRFAEKSYNTLVLLKS